MPRKIHPPASINLEELLRQRCILEKFKTSCTSNKGETSVSQCDLDFRSLHSFVVKVPNWMMLRFLDQLTALNDQQLLAGHDYVWRE